VLFRIEDMAEKLEMVQNNIVKSKIKSFPASSSSSNQKIKPSPKKKRMPCKLCPERFTDKVKLSQHMETHGNGPRYFKCDQCESKFKVMGNYVKHRQTRHATAEIVVRNKVKTRIKTEKVKDETLEINANDLNFGEFLIDALYLDKGQLTCRVRNLDCFTTGNAFKMKEHREKYHQLLEQRISFEKWSQLLPVRFLNKVEGLEAVMRKERDAIDVIRIIENAKADCEVSSEDYEKKVLDPIMKGFVEYLVNLKHGYAGL